MALPCSIMNLEGQQPGRTLKGYLRLLLLQPSIGQLKVYSSTCWCSETCLSQQFFFHFCVFPKRCFLAHSVSFSLSVEENNQVTSVTKRDSTLQYISFNRATQSLKTPEESLSYNPATMWAAITEQQQEERRLRVEGTDHHSGGD